MEGTDCPGCHPELHLSCNRDPDRHFYCSKHYIIKAVPIDSYSAGTTEQDDRDMTIHASKPTLRDQQYTVVCDMAGCEDKGNEKKVRPPYLGNGVYFLPEFLCSCGSPLKIVGGRNDG